MKGAVVRCAAYGLHADHVPLLGVGVEGECARSRAFGRLAQAAEGADGGVAVRAEVECPNVAVRHVEQRALAHGVGRAFA